MINVFYDCLRLVVEPYPSEKIWKSVGIILNIWKNEIHVPNHQQEINRMGPQDSVQLPYNL